MVILNRGAVRYLKTVYRLLPCKRNQKRKIISEIKNSVALFLTENPNSDFDSIALRFGNPKVIATSLVEEMQGPGRSVRIPTGTPAWGSCATR